MRITSYLILLSILFSCQRKPDQPSLIGHWHLFNNSDSTFSTWDIKDTNYIYVDGSKDWPYLYQFNEAGDSLFYGWGECFYDQVKISYVKDTFFFSDGKYGVKQHSLKCDLQKDYFSTLNVDIRLPIIKKAVDINPDRYNLSATSYLDIGKPKNYIKDIPLDSFAIQVNEIFIDYSMLADYIERELAKLPVDDRSKLKLILNIDLNTPLEIVNTVESNLRTTHPTLPIFYAAFDKSSNKINNRGVNSIRNSFAKEAEKPASYIVFYLVNNDEIRWSYQKHIDSSSFGSSPYSLHNMEAIKLLKEKIKESEKLGIRFQWENGTTFQKYIDAQEAILTAIEGEGI
jgi:hypothetical protein